MGSGSYNGRDTAQSCSQRISARAGIVHWIVLPYSAKQWTADLVVVQVLEKTTSLDDPTPVGVMT